MKLQARHGVKVTATMGAGKGDDCAIAMLGWQVGLCEEHAEVEADERSSKAIWREMGIMEGLQWLVSTSHYAIKEACRRMSKPTDNDIVKLERLARSLEKVPRALLKPDGEKDRVTEAHMHVDTDWGGAGRVGPASAEASPWAA